jgi:RNA polymerase sigma factor (TIGR02999 family)
MDEPVRLRFHRQEKHRLAIERPSRSGGTRTARPYNPARETAPVRESAGTVKSQRRTVVSTDRPMNERSDEAVSRLLEAVAAGDRAALDELYTVVYGELRVLAHRHRRRWDASGMLNTTALVHETYLKLVKQRGIHFETRAHFFALAATAIRHIVSNYARDRHARKRGGGVHTVSLTDLGSSPVGELHVSDDHADLLMAIDEALNRLEHVSHRQRRVVECRFFGGMSMEETAAAIGVSPRTVKRDWMLAQAWLQREIQNVI